MTTFAELEKRNADLEARLGKEQVATMQDRETQLQKYIAELQTRIAEFEKQMKALKEIAIYEKAVANFGGEQEGQDYHINFKIWDIDRESYLAEAREQLEKEHPEVTQG